MGGLEPGRHIVCYDYGMGGVWWIIRAPSAEAITTASGDLTVFDVQPAWMSEEEFRNLKEQDLAAPTDPVLISILAGTD